MHKPSTSADFGLGPRTPAVVHDNFQHVAPTQPRVQPAMTPSAAVQEYYGASRGVSHQIAGPSLAAVLPAPQGQGGTEQELPPYGVCYTLMDLYFKHIHPWCPILDRETTKELFFGERIPNEEAKILLHAIVATAMRFVTTKTLPKESQQRFYTSSKQRVLLYGMEHSSVMSLQALVILALDLCGSSNGPPGWNIMALITRGVVQLGLAVETNSMTVSPSYPSIYTLRAMVLPEPRDFAEEESRRRLFWMVYVLDRYATISTAFDFALDDKEIDRTLPCRDELWIKNQKVDTRWFQAADDDSRLNNNNSSADYQLNKPENLGAFSYYIEILGILSKIHKFLKQPVDISSLTDVENWQRRYRELDTMLKVWKFELPDDYNHMAKIYEHPRVARTLSCAWIMLHATYHTAIIRLHSSAAYPTVRSPIFSPSYMASQTCRDAVNNILALGKFVVEYNLLSTLGPPFAFTLWVAARVLLVHGSTVERSLNPEITFFVDTLRAMGEYWPVATRYSNLLTRVLDEYKASVSEGDEVTPSSVRILADMRRTAFDLDLLISRQPFRHHGHGHGSKQHGQHGGALGLATVGGGSSLVNAAANAMVPAINNNNNTVNGGHFAAMGAGTGGGGVNDLEYLDVFDFFNMPRFPLSAIAPPGAQNIGGGGATGTEMNQNHHSSTANQVHGNGDGSSTTKRLINNNAEASTSHTTKQQQPGQQGSTDGDATIPTATGQGAGAGAGGEFNIMDFMVYPERDWLGNSRGEGAAWVDSTATANTTTANAGSGSGSGSGAGGGISGVGGSRQAEQGTGTSARGGGGGGGGPRSTARSSRAEDGSGSGNGSGSAEGPGAGTGSGPGAAAPTTDRG